MNLTCHQCSSQFVVTKAEQKYYQLKSSATPILCKKCRSTRLKHENECICSHCGTELKKGAAIYCNTCLASVHLDTELKTEQRKKEISAAYTKLQASESRKAELEQLLRQKEQMVSDLEGKLSGMGQELEKAVQFHMALEWLQPVLDDIQGRLKKVEHSQYKIGERMLQLVEKMHDMYEHTGVLEVFKRSLKRYGGEEVTYPK
jgi:hypothetical protein